MPNLVTLLDISCFVTYFRRLIPFIMANFNAKTATVDYPASKKGTVSTYPMQKKGTVSTYPTTKKGSKYKEPVRTRYSFQDLSCARVVLDNMGSWSAVGVETGAINGACLWDAETIKWALEVCRYFEAIYNKARRVYSSFIGIRWCDALAIAFKGLQGYVRRIVEAVDKVHEYLTLKIKSSKHKLRSKCRLVADLKYRELFFE